MHLRLLDGINHGYRDLEPVVVGLLAAQKSFMLVGRHGTGKTRLARALSEGFGPAGFVFYDATKDDLITIAGIPDPESLKKGRLHFVPHERTIWDKSTVVVDEITRANKESQNLWLEILEQRSCFGLPLPYRSLIATANPESYASAFQLDEALLDRFHAVVPVPEHQKDLTAEDVRTLVGLAAPGAIGRVIAAGNDESGPLSRKPEATTLARTYADIQAAHAELVEGGAVDRIAQYLGKLVPALLGVLREGTTGAPTYVSARTYARNLPETILAIAAYYKVAGAEEPLRVGAVDALRYAVATKLQIKPQVLEPLHQAAESLLSSKGIAPGEALRLEIAAPSSFEKRLEQLSSRWDEIKETLAPDEIDKIVGELLRGASQKGEQEKLVELRYTLQRLGYAGDALRQSDGRLLIALNGAINFVTPKLRSLLEDRPRGPDRERAAQNIERFRAMVAEGSFLSSKIAEVRKLQAWLIDLREGDVKDDPDTIFDFFSKLTLPPAE
ncbi:MAG: AAA family ATPase [Labilithrix sp.]|nr:AAA family ATPase [Labilithrix sp.]